jgi:hypothetical protein
MAKNDEAEIIVNGEAKTVPSRDVSFDEVTELAYPGSDRANTTFTVLFYKAEQGKNEGPMVEGDVVKVHKQGSSFNVTRSIRS